MAKKDLTSLMDGIIGAKSADDSESKQVHIPQDTKAPHSVRNSKPESREETRATFVIPASYVKKLRLISVMDHRMQKDIISELLSEYIDKWEAKNGKLPS